MSDQEVTVQLPDAGDAKAVLQLLARLKKESDVVLISGLGDITTADEQEIIQEIAQRSDCIILTAVLNRQPIGILTVTPLDDSATAGELGVAVLKKFWSQGVGTLLIKEAIYWYQQYSSLEHLVLDVFVENKRAIKLYRKLGFKETDHITEIDSKGRERSALLMEYVNEE